MPSVCPIKLITYLGPLCIMPTYISGSSLAYVCTPTNSYRAHVRLRNACTVRISTLIMSVSSSYTSICAIVVMFTHIQKADLPLGLYCKNLCVVTLLTFFVILQTVATPFCNRVARNARGPQNPRRRLP